MTFAAFPKALAFALVLGTVAAAADPAWQEYRSAKGGFRVEMPGKPGEIEQDLPSAPGKKMYAATLNYEKGGMIAVASDLSPELVASPEKALDMSRDTAVKSMNATVANEKNETVGKFPARRFDYSGSNGFTGTMRLVVAGQRLYQVNAIGPSGYASTPEAKRFLESFALSGN